MYIGLWEFLWILIICIVVALLIARKTFNSWKLNDLKERGIHVIEHDVWKNDMGPWSSIQRELQFQKERQFPYLSAWNRDGILEEQRRSDSIFKTSNKYDQMARLGRILEILNMDMILFHTKYRHEVVASLKECEKLFPLFERLRKEQESESSNTKALISRLEKRTKEAESKSKNYILKYYDCESRLKSYEETEVFLKNQIEKLEKEILQLKSEHVKKIVRKKSVKDISQKNEAPIPISRKKILTFHGITYLVSEEGAFKLKIITSHHNCITYIACDANSKSELCEFINSNTKENYGVSDIRIEKGECVIYAGGNAYDSKGKKIDISYLSSIKAQDSYMPEVKVKDNDYLWGPQS